MKITIKYVPEFSRGEYYILRSLSYENGYRKAILFK